MDSTAWSSIDIEAQNCLFDWAKCLAIFETQPQVLS